MLVRSPRLAQLRLLLTAVGVTMTTEPDGALDVSGIGATEIGARAAAAGIPLSELTPRRESLEQTFMTLTADAVEYHATADTTPGKAA